MKHFTLALIFLILVCCEVPNSVGDSNDATSVLETTRSKMLTTPTHKYRFTSFWDNRFASSTYEDSMEITYSWLPDSDLGFGFHAVGKNADVLYDGKDELKIDHVKRKVVRVSAAEIVKNADYFANKMYFHGDPKALPEVAGIDRMQDTVIGGKRLYAYSVSTKAPPAGAAENALISTRV